MIRTLYYEDQALFLLDQSQLPQKVEYITCSTADEAAMAIRKMVVRGAPLIGVTAAFGLVLAVKGYAGPAEGLEDYYREKRKLLASASGIPISQ